MKSNRYTIKNCTKNNVLLPGVRRGPNQAYVVPVTPNGPIEIAEADVENHARGLKRAMRGLVELYINSQRITVGVLDAWLQDREQNEAEAQEHAKEERAAARIAARERLQAAERAELEARAQAEADEAKRKAAEAAAAQASVNHTPQAPPKAPAPSAAPSNTPPSRKLAEGELGGLSRTLPDLSK